MKTLKEYILEAEKNKVAIGHFNISEIAALKAIVGAARELNVPIIIGLSEGEAGFFGYKQAAALVKILKEEGFPVFLNADHTKSLDNIKEAAKTGFDAVLFDAGKLPLEENIKKTREAVEIAKSINSEVLVEGEIGYLGSSSVILKEIPNDASIKEEDLTKPEDVEKFIKETGVDLLAPAIGNLHGILLAAARTRIDADQNAELRGYETGNPDLNIGRIKEIKKSAGVPLVLHGGSGIKDEQFLEAIDAGISIIHINTELRVAWRRGLENAFKENPEQIVPYKILPAAVEEIKKVVLGRLKLFNKLT